MNVRVDQTGQQSAIAKINDRCAGWVIYGCADLDDAIAAHQYFTGGNYAATLDIKQAGGM